MSARNWIGRQLMRLSGASRLEPRLIDVHERMIRLTDLDLLRHRQWQRYAALAELRQRYPNLFSDLGSYELSVFSQNGEDGVLLEILHRIGLGSRTFVEFGAGDGTENCCSLLADVLGWAGLFVEPDPRHFVRLSAKYRNNPHVMTLDKVITAGNVEGVFAQASVPSDLDVLSIDVDGEDFWIWKAIDEYQPRVVIIEYNASLDASTPRVQPPGTGPWDHTEFFGASLRALADLGRSKGHTLVHLELVGANAFFVRDDLLWPNARLPVLRGPNYDLAGNQHFPDDRRRDYLDPGSDESSGTTVGDSALHS
jgi:hypothetical protein